MRPVLYWAVAFVALLVGATHAQVGNQENGLALAQQVCSECHAVRAAQARSLNSRSPTFSELATTPGMTSIALTVALTAPCGDADVHAHGRTKRRYHRLYPQPALARIVVSTRHAFGTALQRDLPVEVSH